MPDPLNIYRGTPGPLPAAVASEILEKARVSSAIMQLGRQIKLPGQGAIIPVITSDPQAAWVNETDEKPVSNAGLTQKNMQAYKLAVIEIFSNEFKRDREALYAALIDRLPGALAAKFDATAIGAVDAPGENFDTFASATAQSIVQSGGATTYGGFVAAYSDIGAHGGSVNGFALAPAGLGIVLAATDNSGRPIFQPNANDGPAGRILGQRVVEARGLYKAGTPAIGTGSTTPAVPAVVGVAADWNRVLWGTVEGVKVKLAEQATVTVGTTTINLWQRNMFAVMAEIEVGLRADLDCVNRLLGAAPTA